MSYGININKVKYLDFGTSGLTLTYKLPNIDSMLLFFSMYIW